MAQATILVTGATGAQGGSVARHLLAQGRFQVRALTRQPDSEAAARLRSSGAEVVGGSMADASSLRAAMEGCQGVFGVTNFWEAFEKEYELGKNLMDAVSACGIAHFVFSSLPHAYAMSGGELKVPHFDIKAKLADYGVKLRLAMTQVQVAFYYENFLSYFPPRQQQDGSYGFGFPQGETNLAGVSVADVGGVVASVFADRERFLDRTVGIVGEDMPAAEYARALSKVLHRTVVYQHIPREVFAGFGFPGADDLANMFDFNRRFILSRQADMEESRRLFPGMQRFASWAEANRKAIEGVL
ncbi:MAG: NmrA/HSCARG family protein [Bryobacterales bacterium]|nr:NmrA/HSCARG family protein [Bryobacterales bacterium]